MFPREWKETSFCTVDSVEEELRAFWRGIGSSHDAALPTDGHSASSLE
jgi:hypothetical protein